MEETNLHDKLFKIVEEYEKNDLNNLFVNKRDLNKLYFIKCLSKEEEYHYNNILLNLTLELKIGSYIIFKLKIDLSDEKEYFVILVNKWYNENLIPIALENENIKILVKGYFNADNVLLINDINDNFLMIFPKILISISNLISNDMCSRLSFLREKNCNRAGVNKAGFKGTILHRMYELILRDKYKKNTIKKEYIESKCNQIIKENIEFIALLENNYTEYYKDLFCFGENVLKFKEYYIVDKNVIKKDDTEIIIRKVIDTEKFLYCEKYGIKGKIDVLVECQIKKDNLVKDFILPLELKTGKYKYEYHAQVMLYFSILNTNCKLGLIHYLNENPIKDNEIKIEIVEFNKNDFNSLLIKRNIIVNNKRKNLKIPNLINKSFICNEYCSLNTICGLEFIKQTKNGEKVYDNNNDKLNFLKKQFYNKETTYIIDYLMNMGKAIDYEDNIFKLNFLFNEKLIEFELNSYFEIWENDFVENKKILIKFSLITEEEFLIKEILDNIKNEKFIIFENKSVNFKLNGNIKKIEISEKQELKKHNLEFINVYFKANSKNIKELKNKINNNDSYDNNKWNIFNKNFNSFTKMRTFLNEFVIDNDYEKINLIFKERKEIITKKKIIYYEYGAELDFFLRENNLELNKYQKEAILNSLETNDFFLILGYPGTGKTFTLAILWAFLIKKKIKCLISSLTHNSLMLIIKKLIELFPNYEDDILQLNSENYNNIKVDKYLEMDFKSLTELKAIFNKKILFFITILSIRSNLLKLLDIKYFIAEEASLIHEPLLYPSIKYSEKFILIGDFKQLNPLVKSNEKIVKENLGISLLEKLYNKRIDKSVKLIIQYRMNEKIMDFNNKLVYNDLKTINKKVSDQILILNNNNDVDDILIKQIVYGKVVSFVDIDRINENQIEYFNSYENLVINIVNFYLNKGIYPNDIGIISLYNDVTDKFIRKINNQEIFISTIDKSQGIDKDLIICYLYKKQQFDKILSDYKRINVAFTRSKKKLIIIGSFDQLNSINGLNKFCNLLVKEKWIIN